jgi:hypothetical protein
MGNVSLSEVLEGEASRGSVIYSLLVRSEAQADLAETQKW